MSTAAAFSAPETVALVFFAGFAIQQLLTMADPFVNAFIQWKKNRRPNKDLPGGMTEGDYKKAIMALLGKIITRILRRLTREGHLVEEEGVTYVADAQGIVDADTLLAPLQAASCTYRIARGPQAGRKVLSLRYAASRAVQMTQPLCANAHGFSLHAGVRLAPPSNAATLSSCAATSRARRLPMSG